MVKVVSKIKTRIKEVTVNGAVCPVGVETSNPTYSCRFETQKNSVYLDYYRIVVTDKSGHTFWDSGKVESITCYNIKHGGEPLNDNTEYTVIFTARLGGDTVTKRTRFSTGYIGKPLPTKVAISAPNFASPLLRTTFFTDCVVSNATLYISGNCLFKPFINGTAVTPHFVIGTKGVASAFDVSGLLTSNNNTLGIWLCPDPADYKNEVPQIQCTLNFRSVEGIGTEAELTDWVCKPSPTSFTKSGETYLKSAEIKKWCDPYISISDWENCKLTSAEPAFLKPCLPTVALQYRKSIRIETVEDDLTRYDFGVVTLGFVKAKVMGEPGAKLIIKYTQTEQDLETSKEYDIYVIKGHQIEVYEPMFSCHFFRYAEIYIDGVAQLISAETAVLGTPQINTTNFKCNCISSYERIVNTLKANADYGILQKGYRTLESILFNADPELLFKYFLGLEQLNLKSLALEVYKNGYFKLSQVSLDIDTLQVQIHSQLFSGAESLSFECENEFGKTAVYLRKIADILHTDFIIPPFFGGSVRLPNNQIKEFPNGKYMSEQF